MLPVAAVSIIPSQEAGAAVTLAEGAGAAVIPTEGAGAAVTLTEGAGAVAAGELRWKLGVLTSGHVALDRRLGSPGGSACFLPGAAT